MSLTNASLSQFTIPYELYPKKDDKEPTWLEKQVNSLYTLVKYRVEKQPWRYQSFADRVLGLHNKFDELDDQSLSDCVLRLKRQARTTGVTTDYLVEAFALIREVSARELNMRHYKAQVIGGWALVNGMIAEMETGQGKTLTATLAAGAIAMAGIPTHVITVNRYLAERDADTMGPVFRVLGLSVGVVTDEMQSPEKKQAYACDLTYCTNKDVAFDHLRDRMTMSNVPGKLQLQLEALYSDNKTQEELILRGLCYAIVDEADSVLIDEAVTPLIISATTNNKEKVKAYQQALFLAEQCEQTTDYLIEEAAREVKLTEDGKEKLKMLCNNIGGLWKSTTIREELVIQALRSMYLYVRDQHYIVNDGKVQIVDESTGRVMPDRSWERGLHQMI